jgi:hypothetical protein
MLSYIAPVLADISIRKTIASLCPVYFDPLNMPLINAGPENSCGILLALYGGHKKSEKLESLVVSDRRLRHSAILGRSATKSEGAAATSGKWRFRMS